MIRKLRLKIIAVVMLVALLMLGVIFGLVYTMTKQNLRTQSISMMQAIAANPFEPVLPDEQPQQVRLPYFVLQRDFYGNLVAIGSSYYDLSNRTFLEQVTNAALSGEESIGELPNYNLRYYIAASGIPTRVIFADTSSEQQTLRGIVQTCAMVGAAALAALLALSALLAHWAVRPVDTAWQQQRQFVADASHELKTPLTVILTNAQLLQSGDFDEAHRTQFTDGIVTMAQQMRALVEGLLELARAENGQAVPSFVPVSFSTLVSDTALYFEAACFERGLQLQTQIQPDITVSGDGRLLQQVVEILLDNAQKYASGGTIAVQLVRTGRSHCRLLVADEGDALSQETLKNIFKRFYRADPARTRTGSFGLGLSIAQAIVHEHRGRIWAQSAGGLNTFFVELPVAQSGSQDQPQAAAE